MATLIAKAAGGKWTSASTWEEEITKLEKTPTTSDVCIIKGGESGEVKVDATSKCRSLETTGAAKLNITKTLQIGLASNIGILKLSSTTTISLTGVGKVEIATGSGAEVTTNGVDLVVFSVNGTATTKVKLLDKLTASTEILLRIGILETNGQEVVTAKIVAEGAGTRELILGASTIRLTAAAPWTISATTLNAGTSTIECTAAEVSAFPLGGLTFNVVTFTGEKVTITESGTIATLNLSLTGATRVANFQKEITTAVTTLTKSSGAMEMRSDTAGKSFKLKKATGKVELETVTLKDCEALGANVPFIIINGTDGTGNTNWEFETIGPSGGNAQSMII